MPSTAHARVVDARGGTDLFVLQRRLGPESSTSSPTASTAEQTVLDLARLDPRSEDVDGREAIDALWPLCDPLKLGEIADRQRMKATYARVAAGR